MAGSVNRHIVVFDFETYWTSKEYNLSKMPVIDYIRDPRFYPQMMAFSVDYKPPMVVEHDGIPGVLNLLGLHNPHNILIGHNSAGFDNLILSEYYGVKPTCIMTDTIHFARWSGMSRVASASLASLAQALGVGKKGTGTVTSDGKRIKEDFTPEEWESFKQYCVNDVALTVEISKKLLPFMTKDAILFSDITCKMATDPKFVIDVPSLQAYLNGLEQKEEDAKNVLLEILNLNEVDFLKSIRSANKFASLLRLLNAEVPTKVSEKKTAAAKKKLEEEAKSLDGIRREQRLAMLADPSSYEVRVPALSKQDIPFLDMQDHPDERVRTLVKLRLENNSSVPVTRTKALIHMGEYGKPVPILLKCFFAHTSRYGAGVIEGKSDSLNWQNFSKHKANMKPIRKGIVVPPGHKVVACDSSQIEARVLAYEAQQLDLLQQFADHKDPYAEMASKFVDGEHSPKEIHDGAKTNDPIMKLLRNAGKRAVLSCWAADTEVLTNNGWKRIVDVSLTDKLWDGDQWVQHSGLISNGKRTVIDLCGTSVTPDHMIYDGTCWKTAVELASEQNCLNQARIYAIELYAMSQLKITATAPMKLCIELSAKTAGTNFGLVPIIGEDILRSTVKSVLRLLHENQSRFTLTLKSVQKLASLPYLIMDILRLPVRMAKHRKHELCLCNALADQHLTGLCSPMYTAENLLGVTLAQKRKQDVHSQRSIMATPIYVQTQSIDVDFLKELVRRLTDVITQTITTTTDMEGVESHSISKTVEMRLLTMLRCLAGTIQNCKLIGLTTIKAMLLAMCDSSLSMITNLTKDKLTRLQKSLNITKQSAICLEPRSQSLKPVYDIHNAGPKHRYLVRTKDGSVFLAHNCGYGVGHAKFTNTLWHDGVKTSEDKDEHDKIAKRYHAIYRQSMPAIAAFWRTCKYVIDDLALGNASCFGGPDNNLFDYGLMEMPDRSVVPSIRTPNGFILRYPNLRWLDDNGGYYVYDKRLNSNFVPTKIYGGLLTENLTQSLAFQILIYQAARMRERGISLCCNIHDSFATVVPEDQAEATAAVMLECMRMLPDWAKGLPIDAEVEIGNDFTIV